MERVNPAPCPPEGCLVHRPPPQRSQSQRSRPPQAWGSIRVFAKDHRRVPCILVQAACPVPCWDGWGRRGPGKVSRALGAGCGVAPCSRAALLLTGCLLVALSSRLGCCLPYVFGGLFACPAGQSFCFAARPPLPIWLWPFSDRLLPPPGLGVRGRRTACLCFALSPCLCLSRCSGLARLTLPLAFGVGDRWLGRVRLGTLALSCERWSAVTAAAAADQKTAGFSKNSVDPAACCSGGSSAKVSNTAGSE